MEELESADRIGLFLGKKDWENNDRGRIFASMDLHPIISHSPSNHRRFSEAIVYGNG